MHLPEVGHGILTARSTPEITGFGSCIATLTDSPDMRVTHILWELWEHIAFFYMLKHITLVYMTNICGEAAHRLSRGCQLLHMW